MTIASPSTTAAHLAELVELTRTLGEPHRDLTILAEGNTSIAGDSGTMLVKASGSRMATATQQDFVAVRTAPLLDLIGSGETDDAVVDSVLLDAGLDSDAPKPSMEALLHAICLEEAGARVVAHTHPTAVNGILCSDRAETLVAGALFPDQIVVMGRHAALVPYADPGLALARAVRAELDSHAEQYGGPPKVVYLVNHGIFVLAGSTAEALAVTEMTCKTARILAGALAAGSPVYLSEAEAERIDSRPDEAHRRRRLAAKGDR